MSINPENVVKMGDMGLVHFEIIDLKGDR